MRETVPGCEIDYAKDGEPDKRTYRVDFTKIYRDLPAFQPQWTARRGAQELLAAYQQTSLSVDEFEGQRYKRIDHIKQLLQTGLLDTNLRWQNNRAANAVRMPQENLVYALPAD